MTVDEILAEAEKLSAEDRIRLVETLGPRVCCAAMGQLWEMDRMMRECMSAMPEGGVEGMMRRMMGRTSGKEAHHV
ncbi:MAG: hypothetical protein HXY19_07160 [Thermoanaerobaculaceae bacterium]|nr:hypothetical protein [Thermoanaerobaculaceae bacterium]